MNKYFKYLSYIARHKYWVFTAGIKTKVPLWQLLIHDLSKLGFKEFSPYAELFYGGHNKTCVPDYIREDFDKAWLHHQNVNPHHWQHWVLLEDSGEVKALPMPTKYIREMVADWAGAGKSITGRWDIVDWYKKNKRIMKLHPSTRVFVEFLIEAHFSSAIDTGDKRR